MWWYLVAITVVRMTDVTDNTSFLLLAFYKDDKNTVVLGGQRKKNLLIDVKPFSLAICFPVEPKQTERKCFEMR